MTAAHALVRVRAPARLHMGFLDPSDSLGRRFGGIGVGINEIATRISLSPAETLTVSGHEASRGRAAATALAEALGRPLPASIAIEEAIPGHAGLGSGTQLALAVGCGLARLYHLDLDARAVAAILQRGARSGIGIAVFEGGGLVVDGGRGANTVVPPLLSRIPMPSDWRFLLVLDERDQGLHGSAELQAFQNLSTFSPAQAARLCHRLLMIGLPALAEGDLEHFGAVITELQEAVGDYFAPVQGGRFTSGVVGEIIRFAAERGAVAIGQSSWGPTGFCLVGSAQQAEALRAEIATRFADHDGMRILIASARDNGADIDCFTGAVG